MSSRIQRLGMLAAVAASVLAGCTKGNVRGGDTILFTAGMSGIQTRTEYSNDGEYSGSTLVKERINWLQGDKFTVYSDLATMLDGSTHTADYSVRVVDSPASHAPKSRATVDPVAGNGLQWASSGTHNFYARYPQGSDLVNASGMTAAIPASVPETGHSLTVTTSGSVMTMTPDMSYAFMFAKATAAAGATEVELDFYPEFTAFEFTVECGDNDHVDLTSFTLSSSSQPIAGGFSVASSGRTVTPSSSDAKSITVDFSTLSGGKLTLTNAGANTLVFTVFALPTSPSGDAYAPLTNLTITFQTQMGSRKLALNNSDGSAYSFKGCYKHRLTGIRFPNMTDAGGESLEWDQEVYGEGFIWDNL